MKDETKESIITKVDSPAPISTEKLMEMLILSQTEKAKSDKLLAEALMESRKPYVDPNVLEQQRRDTEERRRMVEMEARRKAATKRVCPHQRENGTSNIKWHEHSNGITKGVCGTCFSEFDTTNVDDLKLLRQDLKSIKQMGRAGSHARRGAILDA